MFRTHTVQLEKVRR